MNCNQRLLGTENFVWLPSRCRNVQECVDGPINTQQTASTHMVVSIKDTSTTYNTQNQLAQRTLSSFLPHINRRNHQSTPAIIPRGNNQDVLQVCGHKQDSAGAA